MLAARVCRVEVRLDDQSQTAADDTVTMLTAQARLHTADALIRDALHKTDVEADLVPLHNRALDLEEGQTNAGLPVLGRLEDEVVERVPDLGLAVA